MRKTKLILIAEDDADDRLMINEAFMENNMPAGIVFFENGAELLEYLYSFEEGLERTLPDLILLDLNMPKMDGKTVQELFCAPVFRVRDGDNHRE